MTNNQFAELVLSFEGVIEHAHFDRRAFKVDKKRIFTTLQESSQTANVRLSIEEQKIFCDYGPSIFPIPNKWGDQGWTTLDLAHLEKHLVLEILTSGYQLVFQK
ncbi:MAG: hypothetical protein CMB80_09130 [Flammeovirgaceae bacterium]|nr:hypothetical protein [Flammeovirgaceae bacterium]MBE61173.1 hypothetical protein [Flammeovirgaceae bacterium]|tara:strand:- start:58 stop:369 length:312 start_codon:yes stop_codon:yes gene_type:complete